MANAYPNTPSVSQIDADARIELERKLAHVQALLFAITGPTGLDVLNDMGDEAADHYLGCVTDLVTECKQLVSDLPTRIAAPVLALPAPSVLAAAGA